VIRTTISNFSVYIKDESDRHGWGQQISEWYNVGGSTEQIHEIITKQNRETALNILLNEN
jgi:hypothetical protein